MTKEIDFLTLGKSDTTKTVGVKTSGTEKKEGLSLFDSLLAVSKEEVSSKNEQSSNSNETLTNSDTSSKPKDSETTTTQTKSLKTESTTTDSTSKIEIKENIEETIPKGVEKPIKTLVDNKIDNTKTKETTSNSLLDRMVLEAKQAVKTVVNQNEEITKINVKIELPDEKTIEKSTIEAKAVNTNANNLEVSINEEDLDKKTSSSDKINRVNNNSEMKSELSLINKNNSINSNSVDTEILKNEISSNSNEIAVKIIETPEIKEKIINSDNDLNEEKLTNKLAPVVKIEPLVVTKEVNSEVLETPKNVNLKKDNVSKSEEKVVTENTSLLDKLIEKAKNEIQESSVKEETPILEEDKKTIKVNEAVNITVDLEETSKVDKTDDKEDKKQTEKTNDTTLKQVQVTLNFDNNGTTLDDEKVTETNLDTNKEPKEILNNEKVAKQDNQILEKSSKEIFTNSQMPLNSTTEISQKVEDQNSKNIFSSLDIETPEVEEKVNLNKEDIEKLKDNSNNTSEEVNSEVKIKSRSLMDRLLDNAKEQTISAKSVTATNLNPSSNDVATNIFLSSQKNSIYTQMLANKSEGVKIVRNASSIEDVKKAANVMDLELKDASVEIEEDSVDSIDDTFLSKTEKSNTDNNSLNKLAFNRRMNVEEYLNKLNENNLANNTSSTQQTASSSSATTISTTADSQTAVNLNVNSNLALTIQNRIIGAQQQMSSMMSDVARSMYENYKPPVTAFRLNLSPSQLGHIAILMKNERDNSISISMNMSQSSTLDAFVDNQSMLRDALNRNFNNSSTTFNLDFNMQEENSNSSTSNNNQSGSNQENNRTLNHSSDEILESIVQNQDVGKDLNYL